MIMNTFSREHAITGLNVVFHGKLITIYDGEYNIISVCVSSSSPLRDLTLTDYCNKLCICDDGDEN